MRPGELIDGEARRAIREDLHKTLVVEAAAGTGKTTEMIARIIAVIRTGASTLERIVAVTFTEKAAGEMKLRLRTELERARRAATGEEQQRLEVALAHLEVARIGTIHSFCADLLRERPIEAGIDPLFQVSTEDEAQRLFTRAFEPWFEATLLAPGEGVRRILRRPAPTELLRAAGWNLVDRRDFAGAWRRDPLDRDAALDHVIEQLTALAALSTAGPPPAATPNGGAVRSGSAGRSNDFLAQFLVKLDHWLAELGRRERVQSRDHDGLEAELTAVLRWWEWKNDGRGALFGPGIARADVLAQRDAAKALLTSTLEATGADLAARLHAELQPLVRDYVLLCERHGQLDFLALLVKARDLLEGDRSVRAAMQERFTHFFVDEFQDTDPLQAEIVMLLCADGPDATALRPGKLFVVGDPKQAIYRFRRADIALYEAVKQRLIADGATFLQLTTSFRSVPAIQSAINASFEPIMRGDGQAFYVPLSHHRTDITTQPAVVALPVPRPYGKRNVSNPAIDASYPDAVGAFIEYLVTQSGWTVSERGGADRVPIAPRHICLVFRRFQSFGQDLTRGYARALEARGIPHVLVGGRSFHDREEVEAVRNALHAIEWPHDELSVYATLRGPLFGFHDEDLFAFRHAHHRLQPLTWTKPSEQVLSPERRAIADALAILGGLHQKRNRRAIADTLSRLLAATRAHAGFAVWPAGEQVLANVLRVMDMGRRFEARGAISFRSFVDWLDGDAERARQSEAPVIEDGTEGVRMMTVHAAKGLEFPVVILCDPTAPLAQERPSRAIDPARKVWLEPIAGGLTPIELREQAAEVQRRDREEGERLTYVAVTRARDLLVVPVVGDEERPGWLEPLAAAVHPAKAQRRRPAPAPGCPAFGEDSVVERAMGSELMPTDSVAPGLHTPRVGTHRVVWWDPNILGLDRAAGGGIRQLQILQADESGGSGAAGQQAHAAWQTRRTASLTTGQTPSLLVRTVTEDAQLGGAPASGVTVEAVGTRGNRPHGKRFGVLVHAILAAVDLDGSADHVTLVAANQARMLGAPTDERAAAIVAVHAALTHPLLRRAALAAKQGRLRREVPISHATPTGLVEGVVDLAFAEDQHWTVIDLKTDVQLGAEARAIYERQVATYAAAIRTVTGGTTSAVLLLV